MLEQIILDSIALILISLGILICIVVLILIFLRIRPLTTNVAIILTCNTYISLVLINVMMLIQFAYILYGDLNSSVSVNDRWCQPRAYLTCCGCYALYYSCLVQSLFRLFRVVFYRQKKLQSRSLFIIAIIIQWILSVLLPLSNYLNNGFEYLSPEYICWISFRNTRGFLVLGSLLYFLPLSSIFAIYFYLIRSVRQANQIQQQRASNERDILVLKRIVMCVVAICVLGIPTTLIWLIYLFSGYLIPLAYHIQGLCAIMGLFFITVCFIFITPQIPELFKRNERRVLPMVMLRMNQNTIIASIQQHREEKL